MGSRCKEEDLYATHTQKEHFIPGVLRSTPEVKVLATKPQTLSSVPELIWWNERASSFKLS